MALAILKFVIWKLIEKSRTKVKVFSLQIEFIKLCFALCVFLFVLGSIGKYLCFEYLTNIENLRNHKGKYVTYVIDNHQKIRGTLDKCEYKFNDCLFFFDVRIVIDGTREFVVTDRKSSKQVILEERCQISDSLDVADIKKIIITP
ncbi:MAG: hypothetical protein LBL39_04110 [Planctomycetaceae bacterium]|nr:hypothetical protein [Planctomycetaceae bacterium]